MRIHTKIVYLVLAVPLCACERQASAPDIDPVLGRDCFESHRAALEPGAQYEGIARVTGDTLAIKVMNGVGVVELECALDADGKPGAAVK